MSLLVVEVGGLRRAVTGVTVRETVQLPEVTSVPGAPSGIAGLAQVRGRIVVVLDLAAATGSPAHRSAACTSLVLLDVEGLRIGLRVDRPPSEPSAARSPTHLATDLDLGERPGLDATDLPALDLGRLLRQLRGDQPNVGHELPESDPPPPHSDSSASAGSSSWDLLGEDLGPLRALFLDEAAGHLAAAERSLATLERNGADRAAHAALLRDLHTLKGSAGAVGLDAIVARTHAIEDRALALREAPASSALVAQVSRGIDDLRVELARLDRGGTGTGERSPTGHASGLATGHGSGLVTRSGTGHVLPLSSDEAPHVRVEVEQIDALMEAATHLVQDRARVARRLPDLEATALELARVAGALGLDRSTSDGTDPGGAPLTAAEARALAAGIEAARQRLAGITRTLGADVESLTATSRIFQHGLRGMRMMEAGRLFAQLAGSTRELARRLGRPVEVRTVGAATCIDKAVAERLADSLLHLLRNAMVHGIESPEAREAAGKAPAGRIELSARQRGDEVLVEVADDGAGVDTGAVRRALTRAGLLDERSAAALSEAQVVEAIFEPGISTLPGAGDLAGRGVGLDAVKELIARLGGTISCASSRGHGTRFTVRLPLTAAIVRALLFKVAGQVYAVPAASLLRVASARGGALPRVDLAALFGGDPDGGAIFAGAEMVLEHDGRRFVVTGDRVIGEREIVVKGLGPLLGGLPLFAGATVSGAGKVQLLLDVAELSARAHHAAGRATESALPILVTDDSATARAALCAALRTAGHRVEEAADGAEALERLARTRYSLLVTDVEMPRLDGLALLEQLRATPALAALPVIVVSSRGTLARERAIALGAAFLDKPAAPDRFLAAVDALLAAARPAE